MCFEVQWIISQAKLVWNICKLGLSAFKTAKHPLFGKKKKKERYKLFEKSTWMEGLKTKPNQTVI